MHREKGQMVNGNLKHGKRKHENGFLNIYFHNKGMEMKNTPRILHGKRVLRWRYSVVS